MFTGMVQGLGLVRTVRAGRIHVELPEPLRGQLRPGASICVNGVCLSACDADADAFSAVLSKETAARTTLGSLRPGQAVNLELPVSAQSGLDGHWVLGHVDATGRVQALYPDGAGWTMIIEFPTQYRKFVVEKGSIAVEGISLTPYDLEGGTFHCAIIPETYEHTILKQRRRGDPVNLEFDILGKYVERMMRFVHSD